MAFGRDKKPGSKRILRVTRYLVRSIFSAALIALAVSLAINGGMIVVARKYIFRDIQEIPHRATVMVLGSQTHGQQLSRVLEDRVLGGIELMAAGKGNKLLLTGDHSQRYYDEVNAMRLYVLQHAPFIAEEDIFMDHAGLSTYDSMYRARDIYQVKDLIIVTQDFHAARGVYLARSLGLNALVYAQSQKKFALRTRLAWQTREYFARIKAVLSILLYPLPQALGNPLPITGDGRQTWD